MTNNNLCIVLSVLLFFFIKQNAAKNVVSFGAKPDGRTDSTQAFQKAWSWACSSSRPMTITVPRGKFVVRPTRFTGPCRSRVTISIKGTIVPPPDFRVVAQAGEWIMFYKVNGLTVSGGTFDGMGKAFWSCRQRNAYCYNGAQQSISIMWCTNVELRGITLINSQRVHISVGNSQNIALKSLTIRAPSGSPNTDGIHLSRSTGITIYNCVIKTGDDCISIGDGTRNTWIQRIHCGPGHGISIGSLGNYAQEDGVRNITVTNVVFFKTQNGVRIKTWERPSTGFVRSVTFRNLVMKDVYNPIIIDQKYCPNFQCPRNNKNSGVRINNVKYRNIKGTSASKVALSFVCSPSNPCQGLKVQDINLTFKQTPASVYCSNAHGTHQGTVIPRSCF
ncbi:polygalacturonase-like [Silene latifolia]|uniref:polygalacturonase-like n=1 Tax=Silene latifolia TaxID=37657 RepID=UPI003D781A31